MRFLRNEKIEVLQVYFRDSTYFGVLAGKLAGVSRIVLSRRNIGHWMSSLDRILMQICQRLADVTIVNCEACRQSVIEQERARPERVHVIPNGLDLSRFAHIPPYQTKPNGELRRIGVVANLRPVKGIDIFIRAAALVAATFPNVEFLIAGGGDPTPYRKLAEECGILEKVRFLGPIENIPDFLSQLDVAVLPSRAEGFSNSLLEYMAAGRPIVATDVGGNPTVIAHKSNGLLVPPEDVPSLGDAVLSLIREENSISRFGLASRDIIKRSFSQESVNRCYSELACKLLAR
jgi:glycosyltransferase involved in cell wall biosynthesis